MCGPTVYDHSHIGHARAAIAFDVIRRLFLFKKYKVTYVSNYTDVDDKMIGTAKEQGISIFELADQLIKSYEDAMLKLNVLKFDIAPRATQTVQEIIDFIQLIIENGYAYESNGSVYFYVDRLEGYETIFPKKFKKKAFKMKQMIKIHMFPVILRTRKKEKKILHYGKCPNPESLSGNLLGGKVVRDGISNAVA